MDTDRKWNERRDKILAEAFGFKKRDAVIPVATQSHQILTLDLGDAVTMDFVLIKPGVFTMGSPDDEQGRGGDEGPQHYVTISDLFYLGKYAVTQAQWQAIMGDNPSSRRGDPYPVEHVSHHDCQEFCKKLSAKTGKTVRLPTEAEWEYACRAGSTTRFCHGNSDNALGAFAWCYDNNVGEVQAVGRKSPNQWGLHDMHGNICEWCEDWYDSEYYKDCLRMNPRGPGYGVARVLRGGAWSYVAQYCRAASRNSSEPSNRSGYYGFRCALVH